MLALEGPRATPGPQTMSGAGVAAVTSVPRAAVADSFSVAAGA